MEAARRGSVKAGSGLRRIELAIDDLTCFHCAQTVERALRSVPGVKAVTVNRPSGVEFVDHDPSETSVGALYEAVKATGHRTGGAKARFHIKNLTGAFIYNMLGLPVALGLFYPFFGILLSPLLAALAMSFSSVTVVANANRLKRWRPS
jgi:cation transport ATPase